MEATLRRKSVTVGSRSPLQEHPSVTAYRTTDDGTGKDNLKSILRAEQIEARTPFGLAKNTGGDSQKCVCFTETPLELLHLMTGEIEGRACQFEPYGVAITKKIARMRGVTPVWYLDITPTHHWLTNPIESLINQAIGRGDFEESDISQITPFIETMGSGYSPGEYNYRKEFWWEREWRHRGSFSLLCNLIVICPERDIEEFETIINEECHVRPSFVDSKWGLEQIIARLAGFRKDEVDVF